MFKYAFAASTVAALLIACGSSSSSNTGDGVITGGDAGQKSTGSTGTADSGSSSGTGTTGTSGDSGSSGGGSGDGSSAYHSVLSEQENDACPSTPTIETGTGAEGSACQTAYDCAPVCCSCADAGTGQWLAASCQGSGVCSQSTACDDTRTTGAHHCDAFPADAATD